ncbi:T9SS type B sorting domain-containing protein [Croceitalea marina]|uniref:T9SS type B sorting domain-containing protein n=1 Tax=Croceitalea marina TaxID=1775166 RepID=A0ABW5MUC2_9FLAO
MRTLFSATCFFFLFSIGLTAQTANSGDCRTAIPVCADGEPIMPFVDGSGDIDEFDADVIRQTGCLEKGSVASANIENNTSWFVFRAGTDGQIGFDIETLSATAEWDFALYGPFDQTDGQNYCTIIGDGTAQPIRCNYEVNSTGFTGIGVNPGNGQVGAPFVKGSQNTYDEWLDVVAGELYYLFINNYNTNFDGDPEPFSLTFTGSSVDADQDTALDCTLRDEFLGLDIVACEGDPDIVLNARNSPAGPNVNNVTWSVDTDDDGTLDNANLLSGPAEFEYTVTSPNSGRYFVTIETPFGDIVDDILITFFPTPELDEVIIVEDLRDNPEVDTYDIEITTLTTGDYEYAINGGEFQDEAIFLDVPPGLNTVIINDKNGCGMVEEDFLVVGYPKFFSPNGDGIYDEWQILGISELSNPDVFIFDRYGKLLKQIDENSPGWDGTFNGRALPSSDYWFKLEYDRNDQGVVVASTTRRHFTLLR